MAKYSPMKPVIDILEERVSAAMAQCAGGAGAAAMVKPTQEPKFGDYQANGVMGLAKKMRRHPRELAGQVIEKLDVSDMCREPEIAGPGFINFRLKGAWIAAQLTKAMKDEKRLGIDPVGNPPVTVIDYSCPNIAKQMHVGHLRSTIIGDVFARVLEFWYDDPTKIIRQNHIGDWGLQMGMVLRKIIDRYNYDTEKSMDFDDYLNEYFCNISEEDLDASYVEESDLGLGDEKIAKIQREYTLRLQYGETKENKTWKKARSFTLDKCSYIYKQLGVTLTEKDVCGESFYADRLGAVIEDLAAADLLEESQGARCVFLEGFKSKEGEPLPLIVQKSDGAYLYSTTDLAAVRYRVDELKAERLIYVTDARQKLHFEMFFACARRAGWAGDNVLLEHVPFGSVTDPKGRPLKTRAGENVKLKDLLDEAEERAFNIVNQKNPDLPDEQKKKIAHAVGIGAVKYADLSNNLVSDYVFDWDKMLTMEGNTAPYMQYAYARVQSIFRKGGIDEQQLLKVDHAVDPSAPEELALAKLLLRYAEVVETVARDLRPHLLTAYLFDLAQSFSTFYTNCPVLKAETDALRNSRLLLCRHTARTIRHGLGLLGIETIEQM